MLSVRAGVGASSSTLLRYTCDVMGESVEEIWPRTSGTRCELSGCQQRWSDGAGERACDVVEDEEQAGSVVDGAASTKMYATTSAAREKALHVRRPASSRSARQYFTFLTFCVAGALSRRLQRPGRREHHQRQPCWCHDAGSWRLSRRHVSHVHVVCPRAHYTRRT